MVQVVSDKHCYCQCLMIAVLLLWQVSLSILRSLDSAAYWCRQGVGGGGDMAWQGELWYYPYDGGGAAMILACTIMCVYTPSSPVTESLSSEY